MCISKIFCKWMIFSNPGCDKFRDLIISNKWTTCIFCNVYTPTSMLLFTYALQFIGRFETWCLCSIMRKQSGVNFCSSKFNLMKSSLISTCEEVQLFLIITSPCLIFDFVKLCHIAWLWSCKQSIHWKQWISCKSCVHKSNIFFQQIQHNIKIDGSRQKCKK